MNSRYLPSLLLAAVVALLWFSFRRTTVAAQLPGVVGGNLDARLPQPTGTPPGRGEIFDRDALEHTKTFCMDIDHMENSEAAEVKEFLAKETGPKKLLGRLPWQLVDDCTKADAVARVHFASVHVLEEMPGPVAASTAASVRRGSQSVLLLYDKASIRLFYRAESQVFDGTAKNALKSPFAMLVKDMRKIDR
jgi:hypothetical protein